MTGLANRFNISQIGESVFGDCDPKETLMRSETLYRTLFESSVDAVMILNLQGFIDCNPSTVQLFGATCRDEILSKHPSELSPDLQSDGSESKLAADRRIEQALSDGSVSFEWVHKRLDTGKSFFARVLLSRMEIDGQTLLQASVRDISERKTIEESLQETQEKYLGLSEAS